MRFRIDPDSISYEDVLGVTRPRHTSCSPEQQLLDDLLLRELFDGMTAQAAADKLGLGGDPEVVAHIQSLLDNPLLDNPRAWGRPCSLSLPLKP